MFINFVYKFSFLCITIVHYGYFAKMGLPDESLNLENLFSDDFLSHTKQSTDRNFGRKSKAIIQSLIGFCLPTVLYC